MSGPQATMNVRIGADIAPLQKGLKDAQSAIQSSAKVMGTAITSAAPTQADGSSVAREFIRGITAEFNQANVKLKAALFQGQISQSEFKRQGQLLAEQFNAGLTQGMEQIGAAGLLTPGVEASLVAKYKRAGLTAGESFASEMEPQVGLVGRAFETLERTGHQNIGNLVSGLTILSATAGESSTAISKVAHAIEVAGFVLGGPEIGTAVAVGVSLIESVAEHFDRAKKAAEDAEAAFKSSMNALVDSGNQVGLVQKAQAILTGSPSAGAGADSRGFKGGLYDLRAQIAADQSALKDAIAQRNVFAFNALNTAIRDLQAKAAPLERQYAELQERILNPPTLPRTPTGLKPVMITAGGTKGSGGVTGGTASDPTASLIGTANTLLGLKKAGADLPELNGRITQSYADLTNALAKLNPYGKEALATMTKMAELETTIQANARGIASTLTPNVNANAGLPAPGTISSLPSSPLPDSTVHQLNINTSALPTVPSKLDELGDIFKNSIASQAQFIAQSLTTVLGVRNANAGGAIGSVIGGAFGQGVATSIIGSGAGAILGSVVPVVGTVIGSLAGGAIGNAIGSLFGGGHKKAVDNSASALNSLATAATAVSQALSNIPQGFKVAYYEYMASTATRVPAYGGASNASGITITGGEFHFHGVQNVAQMYDQLSDYATQQGARRGSQRLSVALGSRA